MKFLLSICLGGVGLILGGVVGFYGTFAVCSLLTWFYGAEGGMGGMIFYIGSFALVVTVPGGAIQGATLGVKYAWKLAAQRAVDDEAEWGDEFE